MTEPTPTVVTVSAKTLRMMLTGVIPHADTDGTLPMLCAVKIEVRDGVLYLAATDRHSMATARQRIPGWVAAPGPDLDALMHRGDAEKLSGLLAGHDGAAALVFRAGPAPKLTVDLGKPDPFETWETIVLDGFEWPDWRKMLWPLLSETPAEVDGKYGIDMRLLARFAAIDPAQFGAYWDEDEPAPEWPEEPTRIRIVRPESPVALVTRGNWFIGAAMGSRLNVPGRAAPSWDEWAGVLGDAAAEGGTPS